MLTKEQVVGETKTIRGALMGCCEYSSTSFWPVSVQPHKSEKNLKSLKEAHSKSKELH